MLAGMANTWAFRINITVTSDHNEQERVKFLSVADSKKSIT